MKVLKIKGDKLVPRRSIPKGTICEDCKTGAEKKCPHYFNRHYDVWGEGISTPDYCPQKCDDLPFG